MYGLLSVLTTRLKNSLSPFIIFILLFSNAFAAQVAFNAPFYKANVNGDMITLGNTIIWKDTASANQYGVDVNTSIPSYRNNYYTMKFVDVLSDNTTTFNSSSSTLNLPSNYKIEWAGLYWQGHICSKNLDSGADNNKIGTGATETLKFNDAVSKANTIYFKRPDGSANTLTAQVLYNYSETNRYLYSGFYNITDYVRDSNQTVKNGVYTIGNLRTSEGQIDEWGGLGGWAMLVIYKDSTGTLQLKNVSIFHGYQILKTNDNATINVSGFLTPSAGTINASLVTFVMDGDNKGDSSNNMTYSLNEHLKMWNTSSTLTDIYNSANPLNNVFNSSITNLGVDNVQRVPFFSDNLGLDLDRFNVSSYMKNGQTNTRIQLTTEGDFYTIDLIAFATDIYQPFITINKTSNSTGTLTPNQSITYTANLKNTGNEKASNIVIYDNFRDNNLTRTDGAPTSPLVTLEDVLDHNTTEISNSIICKYGPSNTSCKNACTVTASPLKVSCTIPLLDINQTASVEFRTKIATNPDIKGQNVAVENKMYATYTNALTGVAISQPAESNAASAGLYMAMSDSLFNAWESSLSNATPRLYTKAIGENISFTIGKIDGSNYTGSICAQLVEGGFASAYQCLTYNDVATQTFVWSGITTAHQSVYVNIKNTPIQNQTDPSIGTWSNSNSTDTFSIRPDHFVFNTAGLPANLRAGEDYTFAQVTAVPQTGATPVLGYNQNKANLTLLVDKRRPDKTIDNTLHGALAFTATNFNFTDGTTNAMGFTYDDVGLVTIKLDDTNWCSTDAGDGTPLNARTISGETNATFIPFDFNITNVTIRDHNGSGFTYLSNDFNMSAEVGMTITARNKQKVTTQNYANTLFENNISITPTIKHGLLDANRTTPLNQDLNFINGVATIAWDDNASAKFNFDRNATNPVNPFDVNGSDMNLTIVDNNNVRGDANQTATGFARFYYGRAHAPDYRFPTRDGNATIYYEVYCKDCNRTAFNMNTWNESVNAINWYQNALHVNTAGVVAPTPQTPANFSNTAVTNTNPISTQRLTLRNTTATPYVDRIDLNSSSWLIAYPTNFTVEFYNSGRWAGAGFVKQEHANAVDNNTTVGGFVHQTAPTKANRRMTW